MIPGLGRSPGEGNGNPLQYPCLENPMDGGAWWATVHGVAKRWTRLRYFTVPESSVLSIFPIKERRTQPQESGLHLSVLPFPPLFFRIPFSIRMFAPSSSSTQIHDSLFKNLEVRRAVEFGVFQLFRTDFTSIQHATKLPVGPGQLAARRFIHILADV